MLNQKGFKKLWVMALALPILFLVACSDDNAVGEVNEITVAEIEAAQVAWGEGLVSISTAFATGDDYVTIAAGVLNDLYGYEYDHVLFKPTLTNDVPFRLTWDEAASYFIGTSSPNLVIPEDNAGFATNPWSAVEFTGWSYIINGETAIGMGLVNITDVEGGVTTVHKSMAWFRDTEGSLRLQLHHSSIPFE